MTFRLPLLAGFLALVLGCSKPERPGVQPEHLVLITVEGLRADHLSSLGYHRHTTDFERADGAPALDLDWIAESGVSFSGAQAASGDARASLGTLHTGASPLVHGVLADGRSLPADLRTLAEDFADAGFRTAAFVSASSELAGSGFARGFEVFEQTDDDHRALQAFAKDLEASRDDARPRLWWLHFSGPRQPWAPAPIATGPDFESPFLAGRDLGRLDKTAATFAALRDGSLDPTPVERDALIALYDSELLRLDFLVRRGFESLANSGDQPDLLSRSAVVVVGASGTELGERRGAWLDDDGLHEESLHVPLLLRHPGSITGRRILGGTVEHADLAPTLRELFGLRDPLPGERSLLARTDSYRPREFPDRPALALSADSNGGLSLSVRVDDERLVLEYLGSPMLFDLARDPSQRHDLAQQLPQRARELSRIGFDALFAIPAHPEWDGDGREYVLRTLHAASGQGPRD
jgi:arylsulfatase A-like enzyme